MSSVKKVKKINQLQYQQQFPGLKGINIMAGEYAIEPFLVFTEFYMDRQVFGPHPHAGISVMTYILPDSKESFINRDSNGDFSIIDPGGLHITQAGSGIHHDEFPKNHGNESHGFQIWINHSAENRFVAPKAMHAMSAEISEVKSGDYIVRVLHGSFEGTSSPYQMVTNVTLLHVRIFGDKTIFLPANAMAFCYGLNGNGSINEKEFTAQSIVNFEDDGDTVKVSAGSNGLEFMFGTGTPLKEQITYGGPFVMTTPEQMAITKKSHGQGLMGTLLPYAQ
jgi:redox-sensitive bicupin YhaK (pirin superfamily)